MDKARNVQSVLVEKTRDCRSNANAPIGLFSPVGDLGQMEMFVEQMRKLGIDKDKNIDFLFICKQGLECPDVGLSALYVEELCPIGTSGCFFEGQKVLHGLGYEIIIATDLDAELDSKTTLDEMVKIARETRKAVFPLSIFEENTSKQLAYNVNDWAVFPRNIFDEVGFSTPYMWRGGEEYELLSRLRHAGQKYVVYTDGGYRHPFAGFSIYHKLAEKNKYYPYIAGILRAILFVSEYDRKSSLKFLLWFVFYSFFADLLGDRILKKALAESGRFTTLQGTDYSTERDWFKISKIKKQGSFSNLSPLRVAYLPLSLARLALFGSFDIYTDRVALLRPRWEFAFGVAKASVLSPIRLFQGIQKAAEWKKERKKIVFPVMPGNAMEAEAAHKTLVTSRKI